MVLVDTSVWIDFLREGDSLLSDLLREDEVLVYPFVIGELRYAWPKIRTSRLEG
jgi:predicted nucleic acid-binding protein